MCVRLLMLAVRPNYCKKQSEENAVSKIVSLRPDHVQDNKPKTKNKACHMHQDHDQNHILLV